MNLSKSAPPKIPRHGFINELAKRCNCSRKTVTRALFHGFRGPKSDLVREKFNTIYGDILQLEYLFANDNEK
jgi:hypothetical protein